MKLEPQHKKATEYCLFCPKLCRFSCPVAGAEARETSTPWHLMGLVAMVRRGSLELSSEVGEVFYHCVSCGRCTTFCKHGNDVPAVLAQARRTVVEEGLAVPRGIQGIDLNMDQHGSPFGPITEPDDEAMDAFAVDAEVAYMPSCARWSHAADSLPRVGAVLEAALGDKVELVRTAGRQASYCCGETMRLAGFATRAERRQKDLVKDLRGRRLIVTGCGHFRKRAESLVGSRVKVRHISEVLAEAAPVFAARLTGEPPAGARVLYHDACSIGRGSGIYDGPRDALRALLGRDPDEMWQRKAESLCCGGGPLYGEISPSGAATAAGRFASSVRDHAGEVLVTPELRCKLHLQQHTDLTVMDLVDVAATRLGLAGAAEEL